MACVVAGCRSHSSRRNKTANQPVTFHRFPKDEKVKNMWIKQISRRNWTPKSHSHICSKHFMDNSFIVVGMTVKYRRICHSAIPTLYLPERELSESEDIAEETNMSEIKYESEDIDEEPIMSDIKCESEDIDEETNIIEDTSISEIQFENAQPCDSNIHFQAPHINLKRPYLDSHENSSENKQLKIRARDGACLNSQEMSDLYKKNCNLNNEILNYKSKIRILEKELDRVRKISRERCRRLETLRKRNVRSNKKNSHIHNILEEEFRKPAS